MDNSTLLGLPENVEVLRFMYSTYSPQCDFSKGLFDWELFLPA